MRWRCFLLATLLALPTSAQVGVITTVDGKLAINFDSITLGTSLLPLANLTDGSVAGYYLAAGGAGNDPAWTAPTWVLLQESSPGSAQTGDLNITGTVKGGYVETPEIEAPANSGLVLYAGRVATGVEGTVITMEAGTGGAAETDSDGNNGGFIEITGGEGTALNGTGTNDGSGGDVVLTGGAKGGATGNAVDGIVRIGTPTVASTKTTDLLAVAGGLEVDGEAVFDDGIAVVNDIALKLDGVVYGADVANGAAGNATGLYGGNGGTPLTDSDGPAGGSVTIQGGQGEAPDGSGANSGNGGDVILLGGLSSGITGTGAHGIVRVGSPTVDSQRTQSLLAVAGQLEVDQTARFDNAVEVRQGSTGPGYIDLYEDSDNGTNAGTLIAPAALTGDYTWTFPDKSGTVAMTSDLGGGSYVSLQGSTPGTADTGNLNISGTGIVATRMRIGASGTADTTYKLDVVATSASAGEYPYFKLRTTSATAAWGPTIYLDGSSNSFGQKWRIRNALPGDGGINTTGGFHIQNDTDNTNALTIYDRFIDGYPAFSFGTITSDTYPFYAYLFNSQGATSTNYGYYFGLDTSSGTAGAWNNVFRIANVARANDTGIRTKLLEVWNRAHGTTTDTLMASMDGEGAFVTRGSGFLAAPDAAIQFGRIATLDPGSLSGTRGARFDENPAGGQSPIGVVYGYKASVAGTDVAVVSSGPTYIVPGEDVVVYRSYIAIPSATTAGVVNFVSPTSQLAVGTQVGVAREDEVQYTVCHTGACVDEGANSVTLSSGPGWTIGTPVVYWASGGVAIGGLTSGNTYWVNSMSGTTLKVSAEYGGAAVDLTSDGTDSTQYFMRLPLIFQGITHGNLPGNILMTADAVLQVGQIAQVDAGTDYRFDVNGVNNETPVGIVAGDGPTAQGVTASLVVDGYAYLAMAEDEADPVRGYVCYQDASDAGYAACASSVSTSRHDYEVGHPVVTEAKVTFDGAADVDPAVDSIVLDSTPSPAWAVGDPVIFWNSGDTEPAGLTDGKVYFIKTISTATVTLAATRGGAAVDITADGSGSTMYLQRLVKVIAHWN